MNKAQLDEFVNDTRKPNPRRGALIITAMALDNALKKDKLSNESIDIIAARMVGVFDGIDESIAVELHNLLQHVVDDPENVLSPVLEVLSH